MRMLGYLGVVAFILFLVFTYQEPVLKFLSGIQVKSKVIAAAAVFLFVPTIAYLYGNATRLIMKMIRME